MTYVPNPVRSQPLCANAASIAYGRGRCPVGGCAEATMAANTAAATKNGTLSSSERANGRFSTKRSCARNTAGKVTTESFPATANRNSANEEMYHQRAFAPPWRYRRYVRNEGRAKAAATRSLRLATHAIASTCAG